MKDKEIKFTKKELTSADIISESAVLIEKMITEAYAEAIKRNIKANTIVINENLVEVKPFVIKYSNGFNELPPMICGLEAHFTDKELPDGYAFSILEAKCTEREALIKQTRENSVKEFVKMLKENATMSTMTDCSIGEDGKPRWWTEWYVYIEVIDETLKKFIGENK